MAGSYLHPSVSSCERPRVCLVLRLSNQHAADAGAATGPGVAWAQRTLGRAGVGPQGHLSSVTRGKGIFTDVGMQGWGLGAWGLSWQKVCVITENRIFYYCYCNYNNIIIIERGTLALAEGLLCAHPSGFTPGTGRDTWNFEVQGIQRIW